MIEGLKPYPEYKDSGLPWLDSIPNHWALQRTKVLFNERKQKGFPNEPLLAATQTKGVVKKEDYESRTVTAQKDLHLLKLVDVGDYVISLRSFQGGIEVAHCRGIISPAYTVLIPRKPAATGYYSHYFKSKRFVDSLSLYVTGIREGQNIDYQQLSRAQLPLPPLDEQIAIVRFLDHANRKIDRFLRAKRKLIGLLNEQKQAIIHRAVTRGLNPDVKLKPSGVDWLGDIPEHWEVAPLKTVCHIQSGITLGKTYKGTQLLEFPYLRVANVQSGHLLLRKIRTLRLPSDEAKRALLQIGDVLMTEGGDPDKLGRGCVWNGEVANCLHQNHVFAVRPLPQKLRPRYLASILESHYSRLYFLRTAKQTTNLASTNKTAIGQLRLPLPPVCDQNSILDGLSIHLKPVTSTIARTEREIALMQEYRTRLTADIVTGKLDVREAAARLPDLSDEAESSAGIEGLEEEMMDEADAEEI